MILKVYYKMFILNITLSEKRDKYRQTNRLTDRTFIKRYMFVDKFIGNDTFGFNS